MRTLHLFGIPSVLLLSSLVSCGGGEDPPRPRPVPTEETAAPEEGKPSAAPRARDSGTPTAESLGSEPYDSPSLGALHGTIRVTGDVPERFPIGARKNKDCTHHADVEHLSDIVVADAGRLANTYVYVKSGFDEDAVPAAPAEALVVDQRGCIYTPHVSALQTGQPLLVRNGDPTTHNVNIKAPRNNASGNVNMGQGQNALEYVFERREHPVHLKCDIHPWMSALVYVQDHPWFAVSGPDGGFSIPDLPPGEYVVEAIHEEFGKVRGKVVVQAGRSSGFALTLAAD